jgi:hypothetical protein
MMPDQVDEYVRSLPGCKRKGSQAHPAWYIRNRLVARLIDSTTLLVRVPLDQREALVDRFPGSFGTPPRYEAHHKVEAYLDRADDAAVTEAIRLAWEFQQSW